MVIIRCLFFHPGFFVMRFFVSILFLGVLLAGCSESTDSTADSSVSERVEKAVITVYSSRNEHLIKPLFDRYTAKTGVEIRYITDKEGPLMARLEAEGESSPADILMTVDAGNLWQAQQKNLLQPIHSELLNERVPANLRATDGSWYGLSIRARTIVYATDRVEPETLSTYEALAEPEWRGRLCLRTAKKVYNQSLVASMIAIHGEQKTAEIVRGWVNNLATEPFSSDTNALEAVEAGQCDVTIVNTYYFGRLLKEKPEMKLAIFWPNQADRGVHINISGAGITHFAPHVEEAKALLEWLASEEAQSDFAGLNQEYPVNTAVDASPEVRAWGSFRSDTINVETMGHLQADAVRLMDRAGYY